MKGIKTAVKTDWKNLAHGKTREYAFEKDDISYPVSIRGLSVGDKYTITCIVTAKLTQFKGGGVLQLTNDKSYPEVLANYNSQTEFSVKVNITHTATNTKQLYLYCNPARGQYGGMADGDYVKFTNFMVSKGDVALPYIDSDELKAEWGAINKARIVALVLSEERRVA